MTDTTATSDERRMLRHLLATLAYRAAKVLRDVPPGFGTFSLGEGRRQPVLIVAHLGDLMAWAVHLADGANTWSAGGGSDWEQEVQRFFDLMARFDDRLADPKPLGNPAEILIQGPLADALTHVGQIAMLRGMAGAPVRPESYARAAIKVGQVSRVQPAPGREFDYDASVPKAK